jgi:apolipoprotein D and lipocalin family protein
MTRPSATVTALAVTAALLVTGGAAASAGEDVRPGGPTPRVEAVPSVDLARYAGRWYEIARLPNRFQAKCTCCVTATYTILPDGRVSVVNECRTVDGALTRAEGVARLADPGGPASRLKVRFAPAFLSFLSIVWGDYWVLDLPDDYSHALVGSPDRKYLWVLAREAALPDETWARVVEVARRQGYDVGRMVRTPQQPTPPPPPAR